MEALCEHENPSSKLDIDHFFLDLHALARATQMLIAAFDGFTGLVEKLSKKYEDPVVETSRGWHAIHLAALNGHLDIVKYLKTFTDTIPLDIIPYM